jgi:uncharacterized protein
MQTQSTIDKLKALEPSLRKDGISALYVFGSYARGEQTEKSDVDLLFDISPDVRFSLFDQARISRQLSDFLNTKVDFVPRRAIHPFIKARVEAEKVTVFN